MPSKDSEVQQSRELADSGDLCFTVPTAQNVQLVIETQIWALLVLI